MSPQKMAIAILTTLSVSLTLADDFKTINGKEYKDATVTRVEPDGIFVKTKTGIAKLYFAELPQKFRSGLITTRNKRLHLLPLRLQITPQLKVNSNSNSMTGNDSETREITTSLKVAKKMR